jgi:hypothetical protein
MQPSSSSRFGNKKSKTRESIYFYIGHLMPPVLHNGSINRQGLTLCTSTPREIPLASVRFSTQTKVDTRTDPCIPFDESQTFDGRILNAACSFCRAVALLLCFIIVCVTRMPKPRGWLLTRRHSSTRLHDWYIRTSSRRRQTHIANHAHAHARRRPRPPLFNIGWIYHPSKRRDASSWIWI